MDSTPSVSQKQFDSQPPAAETQLDKPNDPNSKSSTGCSSNTVQEQQDVTQTGLSTVNVENI